jgi:hypothetical protein
MTQEQKVIRAKVGVLEPARPPPLRSQARHGSPPPGRSAIPIPSHHQIVQMSADGAPHVS